MATDEEYTDEQIVDGLSETAKTVNRLMLTLLALGLFSVLAVGQPDAYLLNPAATVSVPSIGAASAMALLIVGPLMLVGVRIYLQVYVQHWRYLDAIADARKTKRAVIVSPMRHRLLRLLVGAVLYLLVPAALAAFTWKAMAIPNPLGYVLFIVTVFVSAAHLLQDWSPEWGGSQYLCVIIVGVVGLATATAVLQDLSRPFDLRYADLSKTDLAKADLQFADIRQANLNGADLSRANLRKADLRGAELREANLRKADLREADLREANLSGADLRGAKLQKANLREANLSGADLSGAKLQKANLDRADLSGATLTLAKLQKAILSGANLRKAHLRAANLRSASLTGADLSGGYFLKATGLTEYQLSKACGDEKTTLPPRFSVKKCPERFMEK